ncbi:MAG: hypothetical protein K8R23_08100 [Chthoniobacter sp.]|nr:hypothetical protein [Chthoniobacter sp.]
MRNLDRLAKRHAEANEVFGVHGCGLVENNGRSVRTHSECAAVLVLFVEKMWCDSKRVRQVDRTLAIR